MAIADILNSLAALTTADKNGLLKCPASLPAEETRSALKPTSNAQSRFDSRKNKTFCQECVADFHSRSVGSRFERAFSRTD
jgi:hypothetical protein